MTERDCREQIQSFLRRTVRQVLVPAALGTSMMLAGCGDDSAPKYAAPLYAAPMVDGGLDGMAPKYAAPLYSAPMLDTGPAVKYMAQFPEAGRPGPG